ncbi:hypothetical protein HMPREF1214_03299 [Bacteroides sp. HPS0048]|uniref:hypothetical protein n=1 Tax=Bacteroides sp. HPS0048 TaxID=1078089 RepID=UPI000378DAEB|nr:hypothetical protein [Bacteroides sp. HPS0048]EOA56478.1 hypothetical protein HMPREF1214_03299 [Bacteroides sp. HPS0048]
MKQYEVKTRFIFEGIFRVKAENSEEARKNVEQDCGLVMGGNIHTTLNDEDVDWNFDTHPEKKIVTIKRVKTKNNLK